MDFDLNQRIPNNVDDETKGKLSSYLDEIQELLNKKVIELNTIKLLQYLKEDYANYKVTLHVNFDREDNECTWECTLEHPNKSDVSYGLGWVITMSQELTRNYWSKPKLSFINNEAGRDKLIEFMIGEGWQQWKKEGQIIEQYEKLCEKIPNKKEQSESKIKI